MKPCLITSRNVVSRIQELTTRKKKELKRNAIVRYFRQEEIGDINERLQINWDKLYRFYPEMTAISDANIFQTLIDSGYLVNKIQLDNGNSEIYTVGTEQCNKFLKGMDVL